MEFLNFFLELVRSYIGLVTALAWPAIVLLIFGVIWYYVVRSLSVFGAGKRAPLTWKGLDTLFNNLERQYLTHEPRSEGERKRREIVCHELREARKAAIQRDERAVVQSIARISSIAAQDDETAARRSLPVGQTALPPQAEIVTPESPDPANGSETKTG